MSVITLTIILLIIVSVAIYFVSKKIKQRQKSESTPSQTLRTRKPYRKIVDVVDVESFRDHFVLDNPTGNGSDPTNSMSDYSYMFEKDEQGQIKRNVLNNTFWGEIPRNAPLLNSLTEDGQGVKLDISNTLKDGRVGAPRLMSRKLFKGGLFVFDVDHIPVGCAVWPAVWLNGFVGGKDQYHASKDSILFEEGTTKLLDHLRENPNQVCSALTSFEKTPDPYLSEKAGYDIFVSAWPSGGEIDIIEQTNFSDTNLASIHTGASCEVSDGYKNNYSIPDSVVGKDYVKAGVRSGCGVSYFPNTLDESSGFGPYSGCAMKSNKIGFYGGDFTNLKNGESRPNCPISAALNSGNTQVSGPYGSFGESFNIRGGGVYVAEWEPKEVINIWFWSYEDYTREELSKDNGPLSDSPNPIDWEPEKVLTASYILNTKNTINKGCDLNYQGIIINIALGGDWGGNVMPGYCSVQNKSSWRDYITKCIDANPSNTTDRGVDVSQGCYDGAFSEDLRGKFAKPLFYNDAYFGFKGIKVFQSDSDSNVW